MSLVVCARRRASVILVAVGVLFLLSVLSVAFVRTVNMERDASRNFSDRTRALLIANAGVERALVEIPGLAAPWDQQPAVWLFKDAAGTEIGHGIAIEKGTPSFLQGKTGDFNAAIAAAGNSRPFSGSLDGRFTGGTYEPYGDTYLLQVFDTSSMFDINTPYLPRTSASETETLVRILANLGKAIDDDDPPITAADAVKILAYRATLPGGRFRSKQQLLQIPGGPITESEFERIRDYITVHGVPDHETPRTIDSTRRPADGQLLMSRFNYGTLGTEYRRPVNLNTAPRAVLVALLADLEGTYVDHSISRVGADASWRALGKARRVTVSFSLAQTVADKLLAARKSAPFRGVGDLRTFLAGLVSAGTLNAGQAALIEANGNPNPLFNKHNPDAVVWRTIDKLDVLEHSTEFCFSARGTFEIHSRGRVTARNGEIVGRASIRTTTRVFEVVRDSSQAIFASGTASQYTEVDPEYYTPRMAFVGRENVRVHGSAQVKGTEGSVHSNGTLTLEGSVSVANDATAGGSYSAGPSTTVGGDSGGGKESEPIPALSPSTYQSKADFVFKPSGQVVDKNGAVVTTNGSYNGWVHDPSSNTWSIAGATKPNGTFYVEGNVSIGGSTTGTWKTTIIATGNISLKGNPVIVPDQPGLLFLAGLDVDLAGTPGCKIEGMVYAGEQIDCGGNVELAGTCIAAGLGSSSDLVTQNELRGSVILTYNGTGSTIELEGRSLTLSTIGMSPEPPVTGLVGGTSIYLPSQASYDGRLELAVRPALYSVLLDPKPYRDTMLAPFVSSFDAQVTGGDPKMQADAAGPLVAPLYGVNLPGHLTGQGYLSEGQGVGGFKGPGNIAPQRGTMIFWVRLDRDADSNRSGHLVSIARTDGSGNQQRFEVFVAADASPPHWGFYHERSAMGGDVVKRKIFTETMLPRRKWCQIAITWDFTKADYTQGLALFLDGAPVPGPKYDFTTYHELTAPQLAASDISPGEIRLGERPGGSHHRTPGPLNATYGDFAIVPAVKDALWVASAYSRGRYHPGADTHFTSAARTLSPGSRMLWMAGTVYYPEGWDAAARPVEIELYDGAVVVATLKGAPGMTVSHTPSGTVTYRVHLLRAAATPPIVVTPVVDDVGLAWSVQPTFLSWSVIG